jgi:hypothetical protein
MGNGVEGGEDIEKFLKKEFRTCIFLSDPKPASPVISRSWHLLSAVPKYPASLSETGS